MKYLAIGIILTSVVSSWEVHGQKSEPLNGLAADIFKASWVSLPGASTEDNIQKAIKGCERPLFKVTHEDDRAQYKQQVPGILEMKGDIAVFDSNGSLILATKRGGYSAKIEKLEHALLNSVNSGAVVSYLSTYEWNPGSAWLQTKEGKGLNAASGSYDLATSMGFVKPRNVLLLAGKIASGRNAAFLYTPVTGNGSMIEGETKQYVRCGDWQS